MRRRRQPQPSLVNIVCPFEPPEGKDTTTTTTTPGNKERREREEKVVTGHDIHHSPARHREQQGRDGWIDGRYSGKRKESYTIT
ncbi:hypothetical protein Pmani_024994 [Petrolisthes manimaculis]|uniref:Uncharacterized protein n=1 Tax=Petrolisthes manimaculis TaxID=1843537 RepID=A0AAE1P911_9EUCA|nr:hypothetical protein Pmani_024994 [Petrolisthes manimaculis]